MPLLLWLLSVKNQEYYKKSMIFKKVAFN